MPSENHGHDDVPADLKSLSKFYKTVKITASASKGHFLIQFIETVIYNSNNMNQFQPFKKSLDNNTQEFFIFKKMFRNTFQSGFLSIFYAIG